MDTTLLHSHAAAAAAAAAAAGLCLASPPATANDDSQQCVAVPPRTDRCRHISHCQLAPPPPPRLITESRPTSFLSARYVVVQRKRVGLRLYPAAAVTSQHAGPTDRRSTLSASQQLLKPGNSTELVAGVTLNMASRSVLTPQCVAVVAILIAAVSGKSERMRCRLELSVDVVFVPVITDAK